MPNYTDSAPRALNEKLGETPSVLDFGATGDGSTDDTVAVQKAVSAIVARGGGSILFPPQCLCLVTATIDDGGVSILFRGSGAGSGLKGDGITILHLTQHGSQCVDMEIRASGSSSSTVGLYLSGVEAGRLIGNLSVRDVKLVGDTAHGTGIRCKAVIESKFSCLDVQQWATGIEILNDGPYAPPATFGQCSALEFAGGVVAYNANGFVIDNDDAILSIHSLAIRKHSANGIWVKDTCSALTLNVTKCQIEQVDGAGVANIRMDKGWLASRGNGYYGPCDGDIIIGAANGNSHSSYQDLLNNGVANNGSGVLTVKDHQLDTAPTITGSGIVIVSRNGATSVNSTALPAAHLKGPSRAYTNEYGHLCLSDSADATKKLYMGVDSSAGTNGMVHVQGLKSGTGALPLRLQPYGGKVLIKKATDGGLALVEIDGSLYLADYIALGNTGSSAIMLKPSALLNPTSNAIIVQAASGATRFSLTDGGEVVIGGKIKVNSTESFDGADIGCVVGAPSASANDGSVRLSNNGNLYIYTAADGWVALVRAAGEMQSLVIKGSNPYFQIEKLGVTKFAIDADGIITILPHVAGPVLSKAANAALEVQTDAGVSKFKVDTSAATVGVATTFSVAPILSSLTDTLPLKLNGSKAIISEKIDLADSGDIAATGVSSNQLLSWNGAACIGRNIGTGSLDVAAGDHNHSSAYAAKNVTTGGSATLAKLTPGGSDGSLTWNDDGQITGYSAPT